MSVEATGDNSVVLARFSYAIHVFYAFSTFWPFRHPRRAMFTLVLIRNALQTWIARVPDYLLTSRSDQCIERPHVKRGDNHLCDEQGV